MNDGGPAFPHEAHGFSHEEDGMSLRMWLVGQALAHPFTHKDANPDCIVACAFLIADCALLYEANSGETHEVAGQEPEPAGGAGSE